MAVSPASHPHRLATTLEDRFRTLEADFHHAWWESQIDASPENERRRVETELALRSAKGDTEAYRSVVESLEQEIHEPVLRRQLEVLRLSLASNQMSEAQRESLVELSSSVETDFSSYRPQINGNRVNDAEIDEILKTSADVQERRAAWTASKEIGAVVADRVRDLVRLRNEVAHGLGYADYYRMSLDLQELPEEWLFDIMGQLERLTDEPFLAWKGELDAALRSRFSTDELFPWHYGDVFFQNLPPDGGIKLDDVLAGTEAVDLARRTFEGWNVQISGVLDRSDLYPRENKCQHAFCIDMDRSGDDVRILANVVPGEYNTEVMLHESGHAAYDVSIDPRLPWLLHRPSHIFTTESIALLSGALVRDPDWLTSYGGVSADVVADIAPKLQAAAAAQSLLFARWGLVMVHFERELYSDPEGDLDALWWELVQRFQKVTPPPERKAPDWAAKIHTAVSPVYYQNYLLGYLMAAQLKRTCVEECGRVVGLPEAGALLRERVFQPGAMLHWSSLVEAATGRPLSADDFAASLT
jgi:peptidyl-dipeptidase A